MRNLLLYAGVAAGFSMLAIVGVSYLRYGSSHWDLVLMSGAFVALGAVGWASRAGAMNAWEFFCASKLGLALLARTVPNKVMSGWGGLQEPLKTMDDLRVAGIEVREKEIDIEDYQQYLWMARYADFAEEYVESVGSGFAEKSLEHYLSIKLLGISREDVYIDVASGRSPVPEIVARMFGCQVYRQDIVYPGGLNGINIGGDAGDMPVRDGFATKMALHCSFEHFEEDADVRFIREASRVLRRGGDLCILPLYLADTYTIHTNPAVWIRKGRLRFEEDCLVRFVTGNYNRHLRNYDIKHLKQRVCGNLNGMKLQLLFVTNPEEVAPSCHIRFVALFKKVA